MMNEQLMENAQEVANRNNEWAYILTQDSPDQPHVRCSHSDVTPEMFPRVRSIFMPSPTVVEATPMPDLPEDCDTWADVVDKLNETQNELEEVNNKLERLVSHLNNDYNEFNWDSQKYYAFDIHAMDDEISRAER